MSVLWCTSETYSIQQTTRTGLDWAIEACHWPMTGWCVLGHLFWESLVLLRRNTKSAGSCRDTYVVCIFVWFFVFVFFFPWELFEISASFYQWQSATRQWLPPSQQVNTPLIIHNETGHILWAGTMWQGALTIHKGDGRREGGGRRGGGGYGIGLKCRIVLSSHICSRLELLSRDANNGRAPRLSV